MATARLVASSYSVTNATYLKVANASNMYHDTSNTTYATVTNTRTSTSNYYLYLKGFNFSDIPSNAEVTSFTVKLKGKHTGGYSSSMYLCNNTTTLAGCNASSLTTTVATRTFNNGSETWASITGYGANFGIRVLCRRSNKNTQATFDIYGAEIEVTYTVPSGPKLYIKENGSWNEYSKVYKKIGGSWVEQSSSTWSTLFNTNTNYRKMT